MSEETEFHMMAQDHFDCFDPYSEKISPMRQPIHETIKPIVKVTPKCFELKWRHIERFTAASAGTSLGGSDLPIQVFCARLSNQTFAELATALEIILQCRTFSPGVFERDENGRWRRVGENPKHLNTEGC